ncbi:hypothetical protein JCM3765_006739 [Sporobolomyces pararoseus]
MDPFEIRMQFLTLISRLSSSLPSLSKVSSFALKHSQKCSDDIWDCYLDELTHSPSLNHRINMLYLLDLIIDKEGPQTVHQGARGVNGVGQGSYKVLVERDLGKVVDQVVPKESKQGMLNHMSTMQVLKSWKMRRLLDSETLDKVIIDLQDRKNGSLAKAEEQTTTSSSAATSFTDFSRNDILRRIEDDRERHKRLRERIWVLPIPSATIYQQPLLASSHPSSSAPATTNPKPSPISPASPFEPPNAAASARKNSLLPDKELASTAAGSNSGGGPELALEIEFEQLWETMQEEQKLVLGDTANDGAGQAGGRKRIRVWELSEEERREMRSERVRCFHD